MAIVSANGAAVAQSPNYVINGAFDIWQRGTSLAAATTTRFLADRFSTFGLTSTIAPSQQIFTPGSAPVNNSEGQYYHRNIVASASGSASAAIMGHSIEDVRTLAGQTATFSFWAKADSVKNISVDMQQYFGTGGSAGYVSVTPAKFTLTTSWQRFNYTVNIPSIAGKSVGTGSYLAFYFWFDAGSDFNARTMSLGNQSGTFDIWGVQLEAGSIATPFRRNANSIQGELDACRRYYQRFISGTNLGIIGRGWSTGTTSGIGTVELRPAMRAIPTSIDFSNTLEIQATNNEERVISSVALSTDRSSASSGTITYSFSITSTAGLSHMLQGANNASAYLGFSAEL